MRNFIKNGLVNTRNKNMKTFDYQYECDDRDIITMKGSVKNGKADFVIERIKADGHICSSVPVYEMPLTDKCIEQVIIAVEAL